MMNPDQRQSPEPDNNMLKDLEEYLNRNRSDQDCKDQARQDPNQPTENKHDVCRGNLNITAYIHPRHHVAMAKIDQLRTKLLIEATQRTSFNPSGPEHLAHAQDMLSCLHGTVNIPSYIAGYHSNQQQLKRHPGFYDTQKPGPRPPAQENHSPEPDIDTPQHQREAQQYWGPELNLITPISYQELQNDIEELAEGVENLTDILNSQPNYYNEELVQTQQKEDQISQISQANQCIINLELVKHCRHFIEISRKRDRNQPDHVEVVYRDILYDIACNTERIYRYLRTEMVQNSQTDHLTRAEQAVQDIRSLRRRTTQEYNRDQTVQFSAAAASLSNENRNALAATPVEPRWHRAGIADLHETTTEGQPKYFSHLVFDWQGIKHVKSLSEPYPAGFPQVRALAQINTFIDELCLSQHPTALDTLSAAQLHQTLAEQDLHTMDINKFHDMIQTAQALNIPQGAIRIMLQNMAHHDPETRKILHRLAAVPTAQISNDKARQIISFARDQGLDEYNLTNLARAMGANPKRMKIKVSHPTRAQKNKLRRLARKAGINPTQVRTFLNAV